MYSLITMIYNTTQLLLQNRVLYKIKYRLGKISTYSIYFHHTK